MIKNNNSNKIRVQKLNTANTKMFVELSVGLKRTGQQRQHTLLYHNEFQWNGSFVCGINYSVSIFVR